MIDTTYATAIILQKFHKNTKQYKTQNETLEPINIAALKNYAQATKMATNNTSFEASATNDAQATKKAAM